MQIISYDNKILSFYCEHCDIHGEYDLSSILTDNCVVDVDVICDKCGDSNVVYILICYDQSIAPLLEAKLASIKEERYITNGNNT